MSLEVNLNILNKFFHTGSTGDMNKLSVVEVKHNTGSVENGVTQYTHPPVHAWNCTTDLLLSDCTVA